MPEHGMCISPLAATLALKSAEGYLLPVWQWEKGRSCQRALMAVVASGKGIHDRSGT